MAERTERVGVRLTPEQLEEWRGKAAAAGLSVTDMITAAVDAFGRLAIERDAANWRKVVALVQKETR